MEDLNNYNLYDLRRLGKELGLNSPTSLKKKELIAKINEFDNIDKTKYFYLMKSIKEKTNVNIDDKLDLIMEKLEKIEQLLKFI